MIKSKLDPLTVERRRREREAAKSFIEGVAKEDIELVLHGLAGLQFSTCGGQARAFRAVTRLPPPSARFRETFLKIWVRRGDSLRSDAVNDLLLLELLHAVLPPYQGPNHLLYRGEGALSWQCRTYGISWTGSAEVARDFALSLTECTDAVVLEADVPASAIISAVSESSLANNQAVRVEDEYVVDRHRLQGVRVLERLPREGIAAA